MQRFFRSIQSAIFLFAALVSIPHALPECHVLPAINTNKTTTIAAELSDGSTLVGQCEISHPTQPRKTVTTDADWSLAPTRRTSPEPVEMTPTSSSRATFAAASESPAKTPQRLPPSGAARASASNSSSAHNMDDSDFSDEEELAPSIYQDSMESALGNLAFSKLDEMTALESPIRRIFYVNSFQNEVFPVPHPSYILGLNRSRILVYSCGSLWTSIIPCLALQGVATAVARSPTLEYKILLLNSSHDRETAGMNAMDFVQAICSSLNNADSELKSDAKPTSYQIQELVTHVVYVKQGTVPVPVPELEVCMLANLRKLASSAYVLIPRTTGMPNSRSMVRFLSVFTPALRAALERIAQNSSRR